MTTPATDSQRNYRRERMKLDPEFAEKQRQKNRRSVNQHHRKKMATDPKYAADHRAYMRSYFTRRAAEDPTWAARRKTARTRSTQGRVAREAVTLPGESWKAAKGLAGYQLSTLGRVWSNKNLCLVKVRPKRQSTSGKCHYPKFRAYADGGASWHLLHRAMLRTFVGPRPKGMEACHWPNQDVNDCRLCNLSYRPSEENKRQAREAGLLQVKAKDRPLVRDDVLWIVMGKAKGLTTPEILSGLRAARGVTTSASTVWRITRGYSHNETTGFPPRRPPSARNKKAKATARRAASAPLASPVFDQDDGLVGLIANQQT